MPDTRICDLGRRDYASVFAEMAQFTANRAEDTADEIWIVEHDPVFTLGQAADRLHVLDAGDIPLIPTDRGGQVTYHGPGQLVIYPLLDLQRRGIGPRGLVFGIEHVLLEYLDQHNIRASRKDGAPGIYVASGAKIASIGLRVRKRGCYHGLSLNLDMDLAPFQRINPCGYANLTMAQMKDFCDAPALVDAGNQIATALDRLLHADALPPFPPR